MLATTQLVDRLRLMRSLESKVEAISRNSITRQGAEDLFLKVLPDFLERLRAAQTIAINGMTLALTSNSFHSLFRQCAASGGQVRLIIIDPQHSAIDVAANRFNKHQDPQRLRRESEHTLDNLQALIEDETVAKGFHLRLSNFVPSYGIWLLDADTPREEIWVELYSFRADMEPAIQLLPHRDGIYFPFFRQQFEIMWQASNPWNINQYGESQ